VYINCPNNNGYRHFDRLRTGRRSTKENYLGDIVDAQDIGWSI
jgi:hypothetical protein